MSYDINSLVPYAEAHSAQTGIPAAVYLAIIAHENDPNIPLENYNGRYNMFGMGGSFGNRGSIEQQFSAFDNLMQSGQAPRGSYQDALNYLQNSGDVSGFLHMIANAGYEVQSNANNWANEVTSMVSRFAGVTSTPTTFVQSATQQAVADTGRTFSQIAQTGYQTDSERAFYLDTLVARGTVIEQKARDWLNAYHQSNTVSGGHFSVPSPPKETAENANFTETKTYPTDSGIQQAPAPVENPNPLGLGVYEPTAGSQSTLNNAASQLVRDYTYAGQYAESIQHVGLQPQIVQTEIPSQPSIDVYGGGSIVGSPIDLINNNMGIFPA